MIPLAFFRAICEFKLELLTDHAQFGSKLSIIYPVWPWNLTNDLEKQYDISSVPLQALCIISQPSVDSNWSCSPETLNSGQNWGYFSCVALKFDRWPWKTIGLWRHDLWLASICDCGTICDHIMLQFVTRHDLWPKVLQFVTSVIQWF